MSISTSKHRVRLPKCVTKYDLVTYFGVSYRVLWSRILPDDLLEGWGYDYQRDLKGSRTFDPILTRLIYAKYDITDLDADQAPQVIEDTTGHRAPEDI